MEPRLPFFAQWMETEIEFLGINLTYVILSLLHSRILKKTLLFSSFKNPYKKLRKKKTQVYSWTAFCRTEKW